MVIDSHCHLDFPEFVDDLDEVVARAQVAGVQKMLTVSTLVSEFSKIRGIVERYGDVYCSIGTHCCRVEHEKTVAVDDLITLSGHPRCVAIGETGLDYHIGLGTREIQIASFLRHIAASRATELPLIVHAREADEDIEEILTHATEKETFPILMHCFTAGNRLAQIALKLGAYISFSGIIAFKTAARLRELAKQVPIDRLLVETDAPYLAPPPHRGKRNEPAFIVEIVALLAKLRKMPTDVFAQAISDNFYRLFHKVV